MREWGTERAVTIAAVAPEIVRVVVAALAFGVTGLAEQVADEVGLNVQENVIWPV